MAVYQNITTLSDMRQYLKNMLGAPVQNVELHNDQIDQIIYDSVDIFNRYNYSDGNYYTSIVFTVTSGTSAYSLSGDNINDVVDFQLSMGADGINTLFSPTHTLLYNDWVVKGNYPGGSGGMDSGMMLAEYQIGMQYLEDIKRFFGKEYFVNYNPNRQELIVMPTPDTTLTGILMVYKKEQAQYLYNNPLLKRLCLAKCMILWGRILGKYQINMPGGGTINGNDIKAEGKEELEKVMDDIVKESEPYDFFIA